MSFQKKLEKELYDLFLSQGKTLFSNRHLYALTERSFYTVEELFNARYNQLFIQNIATQEGNNDCILVFEQTLETLQNIIGVCHKTKYNSKNKSILIFKNEEYINYYLNLMFTQRQKRLIEKKIVFNYSQKDQVNKNKVEQSQSENQGCPLLQYIIKAIFGFKSNDQQSQQAKIDQSEDQSFQYDI